MSHAFPHLHVESHFFNHFCLYVSKIRMLGFLEVTLYAQMRKCMAHRYSLLFDSNLLTHRIGWDCWSEGLEPAWKWRDQKFDLSPTILSDMPAGKVMWGIRIWLLYKDIKIPLRVILGTWIFYSTSHTLTKMFFLLIFCGNEVIISSKKPI